jgi:hypothetical protein
MLPNKSLQVTWDGVSSSAIADDVITPRAWALRQAEAVRFSACAGGRAGVELGR